MKIIYLSIAIFLLSCTFSNENSNKLQADNSNPKDSNSYAQIDSFIAAHPDNSKPSSSKGTTNNGILENGKLMPFQGKNFTYFNVESYLASRAFVHQKVKKSVLQNYKNLENLYPNQLFTFMECSHEHGGKMLPHRTHQNGLSIDFMVPKIKNNQSDYSLDKMGQLHYLLEFNENGQCLKDTSISIDFNLMAHHILLLQEDCLKNGVKIEKIIFKLELKDELYATHYGTKLKNSGIYFAQNLTPLINSLHDDHYHIDFAIQP